jgi:hypothetical protein
MYSKSWKAGRPQLQGTVLVGRLVQMRQGAKRKSSEAKPSMNFGPLSR